MPNVFDTPISRRTRGLFALSALVSMVAIAAALLTWQRLPAVLVWNLFLAWVPYVLARWVRRLADRSAHGTGLLVFPTALWLAFFPNAPYIVTDLIHLNHLAPSQIVAGAVLISATAALALALGLLSLRDVHGVVQERLGVRWGWSFAATVCALCGFGVWMGRVLRWNSWDLVTRPLEVVRTSLSGLLSEPSAWGFTFGYGLVLFLLYRWAVGLRPARDQTERVEQA